VRLVQQLGVRLVPIERHPGRIGAQADLDRNFPSSDTTTADGGLILIQAEAAAGDTLGGPMQMLMM
jgi:hypothetical protein